MRIVFFIWGIVALLILTATQISAQNALIHGCVNIKSGNLRIVDGSAECSKKETYISWNISGTACWDLNENQFCDIATEDKNNDGECDTLDCQGPEGEPGLAGTPCWDLDAEGDCDLPTEDKNNDGECNAYDCQGPPGSGYVEVYSASSLYLGLLIDSAPIEAGPVGWVPPSITVYVPDLKKLFQIRTQGGALFGGFGENLYEPIPYRQNGYQLEYVYFDDESCNGTPHIWLSELYNNEKFQMFHHIVTYKPINEDVKHYEVIYKPGAIPIKSRHLLLGNTCENHLNNSGGWYELNEVILPFPYPVELPLSFE
jgi:hypothetical protein